MFLPVEKSKNAADAAKSRHAQLSLLPLAVLLTGGANPGPPKPPSLHLTKPAGDLRAERIGPSVMLQWTVPADTTDGGKQLPPLTASICRESDARHASPCHEVLRVPVTPGAASARDLLPADLTTGDARLLTYRVELLNARGKSAGPSAPVYAAAGAAPPSPGTIAVSTRRNAALITWSNRASATGEQVQLERTLLATAAGPVQPATAKAAGKPQQRAETNSSSSAKVKS